VLTIRKAADRGHADFGWLDSRHTFSFGQYHDPRHMGFGPLRVINDDRVAPGGGFATHPHANMEIITYVLDGALEHKDSLGTGSVIRPGDVQRMSAGTGIRHSEFNASKTDPVHFLQVWIAPSKTGLPPSYEQKTFGSSGGPCDLRLVASHDGRDGSLTVHADVDLYAATLKLNDCILYDVKDGRHVWVQMANGTAILNGQSLDAGDGVAIDAAGPLEFEATAADTHVLVFDMSDVQGRS
jgi:quercetin 2,3-dioxygenase